MRGINLIPENIVGMEILRCGYDVTVGRNTDSKIDFARGKRSQKFYIHAPDLLAAEESAKHEFGAFDCTRDNSLKYIVTPDKFDMSKNGIGYKNTRDFLTVCEWN